MQALKSYFRDYRPFNNAISASYNETKMSKVLIAIEHFHETCWTKRGENNVLKTRIIFECVQLSILGE
jgi:hypothetical protein